MKCGFYGYEFSPAEAESACNGCPLVPDCHLLRCPRCGSETPPEAKLITLARKLRERAAQVRAGHATQVRTGRGSAPGDRRAGARTNTNTLEETSHESK